MNLYSIVILLVVGILWGITNPFLKKGSYGLEDIKTGNPISQLFAEVKFLSTKLSYAAPFLLNQLGGILFVYALGICDLSLAVPLTNSLSFVITIITGHLLGEEAISQSVWVGSACVCVGISLCIADKAW